MAKNKKNVIPGFLKFFIFLTLITSIDFFPAAMIIFGIIMMILNKIEKDMDDREERKIRENKVKAQRKRGAKINTINNAVKKYFESHDELMLDENISIVPNNLDKKTLQFMDVYYANEKVCELKDFAKQTPEIYDQLLDIIYDGVKDVAPKKESSAFKNTVYRDIEVPKNEKKPEKVEKEEKQSAYFIRIIDELNVNIPMEEITKNLYETTAMLKQIAIIEEKYPESVEKLTKLYEYYLPMLVNILQNYVTLLNSNSSHDEFEMVENKLRKITFLVNEALKTISMQMCEEEIIDLKSDMSVLEAILRKDGLVKDGTIYESQVSNDD